MALVKLFNLDKHLCADERGLIQILKDAYNGTVQKSQTEQLADAIAQQNIKVHRAYGCLAEYLSINSVAE